MKDGKLVDGMRIVNFNAAVLGVEVASGEEWIPYHAYFDASNLMGPNDRDLVDYDVFIIDPDKKGEKGQPKALQQQLIERITAGGCLIWFAGPRPLPWMPITVSHRPDVTGKRVIFSEDDRDNPDPVLAILKKHQKDMTYRTQFEVSNYRTLATSITQYPIAMRAQHGQGCIIVLPEFQNRAKVVRDVLDLAIPRLVPSLASAPVLPVGGEPDWLHAFPVGRADKLAEQISTLDSRIEGLREERERKDKERRELLEYQGLLWLEGIPLELLVQRALNVLGIPVEPKPPVDLACPVDGGGELYIEIEGTTGAITVRKGRQLLHYIADAETDDVSAVRGAIIGNPFRTAHPDQRPPEGSQVGLFSPPMEALAQKYGWQLATTRQVFDWATRHIAGDKKASGEARKALGI